MGAEHSDEPEVRTIAAVNHRRWPSCRDNPIQVIPRGETVEVIRSGRFRNDAGTEELWHLGHYGEHEGWVHGDYLT